MSISLNLLEINQIKYIQVVLRDITEKKRTETELENHRKNLELLVTEKTHDLQAANEELTAINEDLLQKNQIISVQKEEIEATLQHLKDAQKQLIQSEKMASLGLLTSGIAHEINNPINFISSGVVGLEMEVNQVIETLDNCMNAQTSTDNALSGTPLEDQQKKQEIQQCLDNIPRLLNAIREGVDRTTQIVKGLRTFSRMDNEQKHNTSLHELIESALTVLHNKYKNRIRIEKNYCRQDEINCFPGKLGQIFLNIILNAIQAIEGEGRISITTLYSEKNKKFRICIKDSGMGMNNEELQKIFDPFYTSKPLGTGTGLGLSISLGIVKDHHGEIIVDSSPGKGTEFQVILPES